MPSFQKPSFGNPVAVPKLDKLRRATGPAVGSASNGEGARTAAPVDAESIALAGLLFLAEDEGRLTRFLAETGSSPAELAAAAARPELLAAVLDHLLSDESQLLMFATNAGLDPASIAPAQAALIGHCADGG